MATTANEAAKTAAKEWDPMYVDDKKPFGDVPFSGIDEILRAHVPVGGKVLDLGAGYGRDAVWLARELGCDVTAVEPSLNGTNAIATAAAASTLPEGAALKPVCSCASEYLGGTIALVFDVVLMLSLIHISEPTGR